MPAPVLPAYLERATTDKAYLTSALSLLQAREHSRARLSAASRPPSHPYHVPAYPPPPSSSSGVGFSRLFRNGSVKAKTQAEKTREKEERERSRYSVAVGAAKGNRAGNRYADVEPYDWTLASSCPSSSTSTSPSSTSTQSSSPEYVNANWVQETHGRQTWLAAQACLPHTAFPFLALILRERVRVVVQLTRDVERGMRKADAYFNEEKGGMLHRSTDGKHVVRAKLVKRAEVPEACCVRSRVRVSLGEEEGDDGWEFTHLLFTAWPDHGVPEDAHRAALVTFVKLVDALGNTPSSSDSTGGEDGTGGEAPSPMIVGCSAGVGRTGSFLALSSILRKHGYLREAGYTAYPPSASSSPPASNTTSATTFPSSTTSLSSTTTTANPASPSSPNAQLDALPPLTPDERQDEVVLEIDGLREQRMMMVQRPEQTLLVYQVLRDVFGGGFGLERRGAL